MYGTLPTDSRLRNAECGTPIAERRLRNADCRPPALVSGPMNSADVAARYRVPQGTVLSLADRDPGESFFFPGTKKEAKQALKGLNDRL